MSEDIQQLADWAEPMLASLQPAERRRLAKNIARNLRRGQQQRIKSQQNPDGSAYVPRKPQPRSRVGAVRRKAMFSKIRTAKYLKIRTSDREASVGYFNSAVARIARVSQYGLRDKVDKDGPVYQYPQRVLLGYDKKDIERIHEEILNHLSANV